VHDQRGVLAVLKMNKIQDLIQRCDELIRRGEAHEARALLRVEEGGFGGRRLPREALRPLAAILRRLGEFETAVRLLHRYVHPPARNPREPATGAEVAEYAASLAQMGAHREALALLGRPDVVGEDIVYLFKGFACQNHWDYPEAVRAFAEARTRPGLSDYERLIAGVNLSGSLAVLRDFRSHPRLRERLLRETRAQGFRLLHGNLLAHAAQDLIYLQNYAEARAVLSEAEALLRSMQNADLLFVQKWRAVATLFESGADAASLAGLARVRAAAVGRRHFETLRECDYYRALATRNESLAWHLLAGTPYPFYRERLRTDFRGAWPREADAFAYERRFRVAKGESRSLRWDLEGDPNILGTPLLRRTFEVLNQDFYRPSRLPLLHAEIFLDRHYRPHSSGLLVHQALHRLRRRLRERGIPLQVVEEEGRYELRATQHLTLVTHRRPPLHLVGETKVRGAWNARALQQFERLRARLGAMPTFARAQVAGALGVSPRKAAALLEEARAAGLIERRGQGAATKYIWNGAAPVAAGGAVDP
jgi:hypothetical protein